MAEQKYVVFRLENEQFGLNVLSVEQILEPQKLTKMPRTPKACLGMFDLRGEPMAAFDLRVRFGMNESEGEGQLIVVRTPAGKAGLKVDSLVGILEFSDEEIDTEFTIDLQEEKFFNGIAKHSSGLITLLDDEKILPKELAKQAKKVAEQSEEVSEKVAA